MAATDGPLFISETLGRLTSLEQRVERIGGIESELLNMGTALVDMHQLQEKLRLLMSSLEEIKACAQAGTEFADSTFASLGT